MEVAGIVVCVKCLCSRPPTLRARATSAGQPRYCRCEGIVTSACVIGRVLLQLFQKGGDAARALDLCFRGRLFEDLRAIAVRCVPVCDNGSVCGTHCL